MQGSEELQGEPNLRIIQGVAMQVVSKASIVAKIAPEQLPLMSELLGTLQASGYITRQEDFMFHTSPAACSLETKAALLRIQDQRVALKERVVPDLASHVELVWLCTRSLAEILSGEKGPGPCEISSS